MDMQFAQAELYLSKFTASHFSILNTKIANQNVLERILIAIHNENTAKSNENFRMGAEEPVALVVESKCYCKFFLASNFCLIVDLSFLHPEC